MYDFFFVVFIMLRGFKVVYERFYVGVFFILFLINVYYIFVTIIKKAFFIKALVKLLFVNADKQTSDTLKLNSQKLFPVHTNKIQFNFTKMKI